MIILKLGGSVITDKTVPFTFKSDILRRIASEIRETDESLIIVHGGGSFGHPLASEYGLQNGLIKRDSKSLVGVSRTRSAMDELNLRVVNLLVSEGLACVSIQTSAVIICENRRIRSADISVIEGFSNLGMIPVIYGDVVLDSELGVCILSGDQIVAYLAKSFRPKKVILASDVDGVLDRDGSLIETINRMNCDKVLGSLESNPGDVTGGMKGKVSELIDLASEGISSVILNATVEGRLKNALLGKKTIGSVFEAQ